MFLVKHFKLLTKLKSEKTRIRREKEEELERKKSYWEISKLLYQAIVSTSRGLDGQLVYEEKGGASPVISILSYQVDERLSLKIKIFIPDCQVILGYEVKFYIDGVSVDYDLENYKKLSIIVCDDLENKHKAYKEKKASILEEYLAWREKNVQKKSLDEQLKPDSKAQKKFVGLYH